MTDWEIRRWARYGHERLYAATPGGTDLGYFDVKSGLFHPDAAANLPILEEAIRDHLGAMPPPVMPPESEIVDVDVEAAAQPGRHALTSAEPGWVDLSTTPAGAAAHQRALMEREAQGRTRHVLARLVRAKTDERAWRIGAAGEQAVGAQLAKLSDEWRVLHAVEVGQRGSDIDHVVIGPGGVFTINAKHHPHANVWVGGDTVMINGQRTPYVRNSRHEARRASRLLSDKVGFTVTAVGLIAVVNAQDVRVKSQPKDGAVVVVPRRRLTRYLGRRAPRLAPGEVEAIYEMARRSTTWH